MWHVWPGQWWPMLPEQETEFVVKMTEAAKGRATKFDRDDVIALMNALRCGTPWETFVEVAPGAKPARMLGAYNYLETRRQESRQAWINIEEEPSAMVIRTNAATAARLLPTPVHRVLAALEMSSHQSLAEATADAAAQIQKMHVIARGIERELAGIEAGAAYGIELGTKLHAPHMPGIFSSSFFLADRLTAVSSTRLAALLGETND